MRHEGSSLSIRSILDRLSGDAASGQLARLASGALLVRVLGVAAGFALHVLLGRLLGVEEYGVYTYALSWAMLLAFFSRLGLDNALIRFVAVGISGAQWGEVRGLLQRAGRWTLACSFAAALAALLVVFARREGLEGSFLGALCTTAVLIPLLARVQLLAAAIRGCKRPALAELADEIVRPLLTACIVVAVAAMSGLRLDATTAMVATAAGAAVALVFAGGALRKAVPSEVFRAEPDVARSREWISVALSLLLLGGMNVIQRRADAIFLGILAEPVEIGLYGAASRFAFLVTVPLHTINVVVAPWIAELYASRRVGEIQRVASVAAVGVAGLCLPIAVLFFAAGEMLLSIFGAEFAAGSRALAWLTGGQLATAFAGSALMMLMMTGQHRVALIIACVSTLMNVVLNLALIPRHGAEGAAMAGAASRAFTTVAMLVFVVRRLHVDPSLVGAIRWGSGQLIRVLWSRR